MKLVSLVTATAALLLPVLVTSLPLNDDSAPVQHHAVKVKRQCFPNGSFYDDATHRVPIEYIGDWTHLSNQGSTVHAGTLSYTGQANAMVKLPNPLRAGWTHTMNVTVWSTKKRDRGQFNIYSGTTLLGTSSQYTSDSQETSTQRVFYRQNIQVEGGLPFVIKNDKGAPFMAFDALELEFFTCYNPDNFD